MAGLNIENRDLQAPQENISSNGKDKITLATAALAIALSTSVQANKLLEECDGIDRQGVIHQDKINGVINGFAEKKCETEFLIAKTREETSQTREETSQTREETSQIREEIAKLDLILAMLSPEEHRDYLENEILKIEEQLKTETNEIKINDLNAKLLNLKELLEKLDNNLA